MWANYLTGGGKTIAVLDTGVDRLHPFLGGRVVEEACFSSGSDCPNGQTTQTGTGSAAPCIYSARLCLHGTHVAGIAAGQGLNSSGVAPNANIMAVQVFHRATGTDCTAGSDPCPKASTRDLIKALERVYQLRNTYDFAAVNMSLGSDQFTDYCDAEGTDFLATKAIIDNLKAASTATVLSSGNEGSTDAVGFPGCISSAITVGNTTKQDTVAIQSNMAPWSTCSRRERTSFRPCQEARSPPKAAPRWRRRTSRGPLRSSTRRTPAEELRATCSTCNSMVPP
jgi:subtilisin family serine protease